MVIEFGSIAGPRFERSDMVPSLIDMMYLGKPFMASGLERQPGLFSESAILSRKRTTGFRLHSAFCGLSIKHRPIKREKS